MSFRSLRAIYRKIILLPWNNKFPWKNQNNTVAQNCITDVSHFMMHGRLYTAADKYA